MRSQTYCMPVPKPFSPVEQQLYASLRELVICLKSLKTAGEIQVPNLRLSSYLILQLDSSDMLIQRLDIHRDLT